MTDPRPSRSTARPAEAAPPSACSAHELTGWRRYLTTPLAISRIVLLLGLITLGSAASPTLHDRLRALAHLVPGAVPAAATTADLAVATVLIVVSRAVRRGKRRAWALCVVLVSLSMVFDLAKGLDVEEAAFAAFLLALLVLGRRHFTARPDPRSTGRVLTVLLAGPVVATLLGTLWLSVDRYGQAPGTTLGERFREAGHGLLGLPGPIRWTSERADDASAIALAVLGLAVLLVLLLALMMPADGPHPLTDEEDAQVRGLLARHGARDSLGYFATRRDRCLLALPTGRAAVSYRVLGTVSLAAGDPLGEPDCWPDAIAAWLEECESYGWSPAVLGAGEAAAEAYRRAGLDALEIGDEAVLDTAGFSLEGRAMRGVRQAVTRCQRAGLSATCARVRDLDDAQRREILDSAEAWREGAERGFSMALDRVADLGDPEAVVVCARDADGVLHGVLGLVPWGPDGLSLDLMRRRRDSANGIVELLVATLALEAGALGVRRVSLNFAVFRGVFARGDRVGAGPVLRLWCAVLRWASRYWQIESLYRSNAKYHPEWSPRFLCFRRATDLPRILTAALRAEGFLVLPSPSLRLPGARRPVTEGTSVDA
ncbi:phosphatidylglycerol lysyltransferase domain-containing protein [Nocardioides sp. TRM66260-LWL]|uniref:phosphatidylglycerol lysyltransferase domain-containing protein n=1 Tax=Nocardioides sp. TRM66260-LWL TaxID=2874478 RepID=UPI001CC6EAA8|nr:phosphatidylglycerol lysyltransferase domain-containing protein [Nocardioides sp. TRM66260-LWL]MBZ5735048.1 phosphatidylglycerol lysyltransferase domain-containing protein [Nocardioides sp. TRM66260-LWL]